MISSQGVPDTFMYNMDKFCIIIVIWSIDIRDDEHILVGALNWFSVEPPTGRVAGPSLIYPPFPFKTVNFITLFEHKGNSLSYSIYLPSSGETTANSLW